MDGLSNSDVALLSRDGGMMSEGGAFFWIFALLILAGGGGFGGFGNRGDYVSQADLAAGLNNNQTQAQLSQIALSSANNNYETARLISDQNVQMMQQNNANLINAIQGFNQVQQQLTSQNGQILNAISQLGYQMDQCCCSIKTQMLQDRLDAANAALVAANGNISNANQSQYILSQLGRFVAWTPSGSQAATTGA